MQLAEFFDKHKFDFKLAISVAFLIVAVLVLAYTTGRAETNNVVLPEFDNNAIVGVFEIIPEEYCYSKLSDTSLPFEVGLCGKPGVKDGLEVYFTNPYENNAWLMLQVIDKEGNILGQTGLIEPSAYIKTVDGDFSTDQEIGMRVIGYVPDLYYSMGTFTIWTTTQAG